MIPRGNHRKQKPHKPQRDLKGVLKFVMVASLIVLGLEYTVFSGQRPYMEQIKADYYARKAIEEKALAEVLPPKVEFSEEELQKTLRDESLILNEGRLLLPEKQFKIEKLVKKEPAKATKKITKKKAMVKPSRSKFTGAKPKIAIVIDDVGMNIKQSHAAVDLPAEVTLAMLPYAKQVKSIAAKGKKKGHELIIHTPMEAMSKDVSLGSLALHSNMDKDKLREEFNKITKSFDGYVGVNNHMGSRLTQDTEAMGVLMDELKKKGLYFLDSRTIGSSIAAETAVQKNVPTAIRDVFLDHEDTPAFVAQALKKTERIARQQGSAIAIGHPKGVTMAALRQWIPTLEEKGFELVPLSHIIKKSKVKQAKQKVRTQKSKPQKSIYMGGGVEMKSSSVSESVDTPLMDLDYVVDSSTVQQLNDIAPAAQNDIQGRPKKIQMFKEGQEKISYPMD